MDGVENAEPEPEGAADQGAVQRGGGPGEPGGHAGGGPEDLGPARGAEADGEDRDDPGVVGGEFAEEGEEGGPDSDEEGEDQQRDRPWWGVVAGPEVAPVAAVR